MNCIRVIKVTSGSSCCARCSLTRRTTPTDARARPIGIGSDDERLSCASRGSRRDTATALAEPARCAAADPSCFARPG